ncbi:hypothetical protein GYH30_045968 [Glycine max]|nr:hypothetical protein GYH30_045968 [Glycine max]
MPSHSVAPTSTPIPCISHRNPSSNSLQGLDLRRIWA